MNELRSHYRRLLERNTRPAAHDAPLEPGLEGEEPERVDDGESWFDLSDAEIRGRVDDTRTTLLSVVDQHLGGGEDLRQIARELLDEELCMQALDVLHGDDDGQRQADPAVIEQLEAIVLLDGRPSFMVRDGVIDRTTSPIGPWAAHLDKSGLALTKALGCVGRIDDPEHLDGFAGTGFLVQENLIVTNRHVLQMIGAQNTDGSWSLKPGMCIDFGHEFKARTSLRPRVLDRVVFAGSEPIEPTAIDHTRLDLALIELAPANAENRPRSILSINTSPGSTEDTIYVVGYPAAPLFEYRPSKLEELFKSTFGYKRLAPGKIMTSHVGVPPWTLAHDATTLFGNSGSAVLLFGAEGASMALHYGGKRIKPGENWAHVLGLVLDERDGIEGHSKTLRDHLRDYGVTLTGES